MAELTEEQKIIIGVCVGVAGLILIALVIFICWAFYSKGHWRHKRRPKDYYIDRRPPYTVYEKTVPPPYEPAYIPPPIIAPMPPPRREIYYKRPRSHDVLRYDTWDRFSEPPKRPNTDSRWYRNEPIVVPLAEPEYVATGEPRRESDTIYLKYVDDQALLPRTNYQRRSEYTSPVYATPLRRSRSFHSLRRSTPYVGEWGRRPEQTDNFNEYAMRAGRDPFLWQ